MKAVLQTTLKTALIASVLTLSTWTHAATSPMTVNGATTVNAAEAKQLWEDGAVFLDSRKATDWEAGHIPEAVHLDRKNPAVYNLDALNDLAAKDEAIVSYCNGERCLRSSKTADDLVKLGFKKVYYFRDGFPAWSDMGYPIE